MLKFRFPDANIQTKSMKGQFEIKNLPIGKMDFGTKRKNSKLKLNK